MPNAATYIVLNALSNQAKALAALQTMVLKINGDQAFVQKQQATFNTLIDRYIESERLSEIKAVRPGNTAVKGGVHYSTACSYLTSLNRYIRPRWGETLLNQIKPAAVDDWLKALTRLSNSEPLSPKTRGNIKAMMYRLLEKAMFWELLPLG